MSIVSLTHSFWFLSFFFLFETNKKHFNTKHLFHLNCCAQQKLFNFVSHFTLVNIFWLRISLLGTFNSFMFIQFGGFCLAYLISSSQCERIKRFSDQLFLLYILLAMIWFYYTYIKKFPATLLKCKTIFFFKDCLTLWGLIKYS